MIDLRLIGSIEVLTGDARAVSAKLTQPKRLALLMYLALAEPAGLHARDRLLALLWPEADDASSRHSLRNALHALRQALGDEAIVTRGEGWVGLDFAALRCDVLELRAHLAAGRVEEAIAGLSRELAPGFHVSGAPEFDRWLEEQRRLLLRAVRTSAWKRARELEGTGAGELDALRRAVRLDPGNEPGTRRLMQLLAATGDSSGAMRVYQELADWLAHELETQPSAESRAIAERLRIERPMHGSVVRGETDRHAPVVPSEVRDPDDPVVLGDASGPLRRRISRRALAIGLTAAAVLGVSAYLSRAGTVRRTNTVGPAESVALRLPARYRTDTAAYSSYLRGLTLRFQFQFVASRDTLAALVDRKPLYVPGLYGLAHAWIFLALSNQSDPDDAWPRAEALARRALALDSSAANAWLVLASEDEYLHLDLARAGERLLHARKLDSLDADVPGMRSVWFRFHGDMDSAVVEAQRAHRLDPFSLMLERLLAKQLYYARRYDESRQAFLRMLQNSPSRLRGYRDLAQLSVATGHPREAVDWLHQALAADGDSVGAAALPTATSDDDAKRLLAREARRTIARMERAARAHERIMPATVASAYAALGDTAATLRWLDSIRIQHDTYLNIVRVDPAFDFLRNEPAYRAWDDRSGLPRMKALVEKLPP